MCELLGVSLRKRIQMNDLLKEFFSHSTEHPNGWGMAFFYGNAVSLEKEPITAYKSTYLKERLRHKIETASMLAHIRLATRGNMDYQNCHPFVHRDCNDRTWTLMHNGTVFDAPELDRYFYLQEGQTDSERILYYIVDQINIRQEETGGPLTERQRFDLLEGIISRLARRSKLNLIFFDGELMYTHTNYACSLNVARTDDGRIFATKPIGQFDWKPLPMNTLCAWKDGEPVFIGTAHNYEYIDNEEDMRLLFYDYAGL